MDGGIGLNCLRPLFFSAFLLFSSPLFFPSPFLFPEESRFANAHFELAKTGCPRFIPKRAQNSKKRTEAVKSYHPLLTVPWD